MLYLQQRTMGQISLDSKRPASENRCYATGVQGVKDPRLFYPVLFCSRDSRDQQDLSPPDDHKHNKGKLSRVTEKTWLYNYISRIWLEA